MARNKKPQMTQRMSPVKDKKKRSVIHSLGREIKISPKTHVDLSQNVSVDFHDTVVAYVIIGIGNDHCAYLYMSEGALNALRSGEPIDITTVKNYRERGF